MDRWIWPFLLLAATFGVAVLLILAPGGALQTEAVAAYLFICPGMALVRLLNLRSPLAEWVIALALSITLDILISEMLVLAHLWSPVGALVILGGLCVLGSAAQLRRAAAVYFPKAGSG